MLRICEAAKKYFDKNDTVKFTDDHPALVKYNSKTVNKYCFDKYGLIVRTNDSNKKNPTGYIIDNYGNKVNINVDQRLAILQPETIRFNTISALFGRSDFSQGCNVGKLYQEIYPDYFN